jgi:predicted regulator of Ras-like GTPase activity (Roadblock/LC7/MglB family)
VTDLKRILENFCRVDLVRGALILDDQGLLIEEYFNEEPDSGAVANLVLRAVQLGKQMVEELGKSPLNQQYIEFADCQITAEQLASECVLVVVAKANANLGRLRLEIRKSKAAVEAMLA